MKPEYQAGPFKESFQIAPAGRVPHPAVKDEFLDWCLKNSFTEAIDCMNAFLEECRLLAALFRLGSATHPRLPRRPSPWQKEHDSRTAPFCFPSIFVKQGT